MTWDKFTLEKEFQRAGLEDALTFDERNVQAGGAGFLDPITAAVVVSGMALTVVGIRLCRSQRSEMTIEGPEDFLTALDFALKLTACPQPARSFLSTLALGRACSGVRVCMRETGQVAFFEAPAISAYLTPSAAS